MDDQDKMFFNYLVRNQPQILPYFRLVPWQPKNQKPSSHQGKAFNTCLSTNQSETWPQETKAAHNVLPSTNLDPNVVQTPYASLGEHKQQPVPLTPSNFPVVQRQQVAIDPFLAFRQSTGGAYHALCDAIGIDRFDPQISILFAKPGNFRLKSNDVTAASVHNFQQGKNTGINNCALQSLGDATHPEGAWISNEQTTAYCTPLSNSAHFINESNKQPRNNYLSKFSDDHKNTPTSGQNGLSDPRWCQAMQCLDNWDDLLHTATNATDSGSIDYLLLSNNSDCYTRSD